jgi:PAS domain S-box-containing protein
MMAKGSNEDLELKRLREQLHNCQANLEAQQASADRAQKVQSALYRIAEAASGAHDMHDFYAAMHAIVGELMYAVNFFIALYDEQSDRITWPYYMDTVDLEPPAPSRLKDFRGATGWVLRHGKTIANVDGSWQAAMQRGEAQIVGTEGEGIAVPLIVDDKTFGVILIQSYLHGIGYQPEDVKVLEFVARHIAAALSRARAIEETRQRNAELEVINSIQEGLVSELDVQAIIDLVGDKVQEIFNVSEVEIALYDAEIRMISFPFWSVQGGRVHQESLPLGTGLMSYLIQTRRPLIMTAENREWISQTAVMPDGLPMRKSFIGAPIISGDEVIGAISLHEPTEENAYDEADLRLLITVANSMGVALENARLFEETQLLLKETKQRNAELGILNSVGEAMAQSLEVKTITHIIGEKLRDIFDYAETVDIQLFDSKTNLIQPSYIFCGNYYDVEQEPPYPLSSNLTSSIIRSRKPLLFHTTKELDEAGIEYDTYVTAPAGYPESESYMAVPIIAGDEVLGVVDVQSYQPNAFDENSLRLLQTLSANMGVAIQNARQFEQTQRLLKETEQRNAELAIINSVQTALASKLDFQGIIETVGTKLTEIFAEENIGIGFLDKTTQMFKVPYLFENGRRIDYFEFPIGDKGLVSHMLKTRQPLVINTNFDQRADEIGVIDVSGEPNPKSWLGVPIILNDEVIGGFSMQNWERENAFAESKVRLLQTLAGSLGVALESARLFAEVQTRNQEIGEALEQQTATSEVLRALSGFQPDLRTLLEIIAVNVAKVCGADDAHIYRIEGEALKEWTHRGPIPGLEAGESLPLNRDSVIGRAIVEREIIHIHDAAAELDETEYPVSTLLQRRWGYRTVLATPLLRDGEPIGGIAIRRKEMRPFTEKQVELVRSFADQAVIAIENVRLFEETQRLLKDTQQRAAELAIINSVQSALAVKLDFQGIVEIVGRKLTEIFSEENVGIGFLDKAAQTLKVPYAVENGKRLAYFEVPHGDRGLVNFALKTRQPLVINTQYSQRHVELGGFNPGGTPDPKSWLGVPIIIDNEAVGAFTLQNWERENAYSEADVSLLQTLAGSLGVALENARLFEEIQQRTAELSESNKVQTALYRIAETATAVEDMPTFYRRIHEIVREIMNAENFIIQLYDDVKERVSYPYVVDTSGELKPLPAVPITKIRKGLAMYSLQSNQTLHVSRSKVDEMVARGEIESISPSAEDWVSVPLQTGGKTIGVIAVQQYEPGESYTDKDVRLLEYVARHIAASLERARSIQETQRLLKETEQRAAELAIINSVQEGLASKLDIQGIYDLVGDKIRDIFDAQKVQVMIYDRQTDTEYYPYVIQKGERLHQEPFRHDETGFGPLVMRTRQSLMINQDMLQRAQEVGSFIIGEGGSAAKSAIFVPLLIGEEPRGVISIQNIDREHAFTDSDLRLLVTLTNAMSVALENARLFDETQRLLKETEQRAAELQIINHVGEAMSRQLDVRTITRTVGDKITEIFKAEATSILMLDTKSNLILPIFEWDEGKYIEHVKPFPLGQGLTSRIIQSRQPLVLGTAEEAANFGVYYPPEAAETNPTITQSYLGVPVIVGENVIGVVSVNTYSQHAYTEDSLRLISTLANNMGVALENARLFEKTQQLLKETEQRAAELAIINSVQQGLAAQIDFEAIIDLVGDKIREVFQADTTFIALYNPKDQIIDFPYYVDKGHRHPFTSRFGGGLTSHIIQSRRPLLLRNPEEAAGYDIILEVSPGSTEDLNRTFLGVPVVVGDQVIGVISVQSYQPNAYGESEERLLSTVAASMGVALENARLFVETQQRATELQTVNAVSQALVAETELEALIQLTGEQVRRTFNADIVYVAMLDEQSNQIEFPYGYGEEFPVLLLGEGLTSKIIEAGQPLLINRDMETRRSELGATQVGKQARSFLGVPIIVGRQAIGVISVQNTQEEGLYTESDVRLLSTIAANVGTAIRNARLFNEISRQKNYYEMIIANSPAAIILIDGDLRITGWNPAAERLFGYSQAEAMGQIVDDLVARDPDLHAEAARYSLQALSENRVHLIAKRNRKDGTLVDVEVMGLPVLIEGQNKGYVVIYHDITELERARRQAIEANQAKSAFLANMSHELRTPLNAIIGFTRIVRRKGEGALPEKQLDNLDKVLISAEHLLNLINTVLDIAKIESGRMDVQPSHFQIRPLVDLVATTSQPLVRQDTVNLVTQVDPDLPLVHSDLEKIKQILLNLVSNAAKFTHAGQITVSAGQDAERLVVNVSDTGIGISQEALPRIFEEFQQADTSTTREYGGTGLGLSISRSLARLLGGDLTAESVEGQGSTFTLTVPLSYSAPAEPTKELADGAAFKQEPDRSHPLVLVIDDNQDAVALLKDNLEEAGYQVITAHNGEQGLQLARQQHPLAITLDIMMPNKDGWQVLHDLKADPFTRKIPVILISIIDKKALGFRLGAADYLVKPIKENELLDTLERITQDSGGVAPRSLLVVDDDPTVVDLLTQLLEGTEYRVESASDGEQALAMVKRERPDALLLDLVMPRLDGFQLIEILHSQPDLSSIPIIVFTAKSLTDAEAEFLSRSACGIIQKQGLQGDVLLRQIETALEDQSGR